MPVNRQDTVDTSELLRELRIDRDGRPPRARWRRLVVAEGALVALGAGDWLALSRISTPAVGNLGARAAAPAGAAVGFVSCAPRGRYGEAPNTRWRATN